VVFRKVQLAERHTQFCCGWSVEHNDFTTHVHILWMALSYRLRGEEECALRVDGTVGLHLGTMAGLTGVPVEVGSRSGGSISSTKEGQQPVEAIQRGSGV
jgi:hypothetical protein